MHLIQFSKFQFSSLNQGTTKLDQYIFLEGAVPPDHVIQRAVLNSKSGVNDLWALPYFMVQDGLVLGSCGFKREPDQGVVEIGYQVALEARGKGVASLAVTLLSDIAFQTDQAHTIQALILSQNEASLSVVQRNGFTYMGNVLDDENELLECWELKQSV